MKTSAPTLLALLLAVSLPVTGCSKEPAAATLVITSPAVASVAATPPAGPDGAQAPVPPTDPCAEMKAALEKSTLEQHEGLSGIQQRMDKLIDAQVVARKLTANVSLAADEKLDSATEDFAEKLRMLTLAGTETWASAKHDTELALLAVHAAFTAVMNSPLK